jgi:hypothetical protein
MPLAFPIINESIAPPPPLLTFRIMVRVVELLNVTEAAVISREAVKVTSGGADELNSKPAGAFSTRVTAVPPAMSVLLPSVIVIGPRTVHAGEAAFADLSAEILVPPVALVIVTLPKERPPISSMHADANRERIETPRPVLRKNGKTSGSIRPEHTLLAEEARTLCFTESNSI